MRHPKRLLFVIPVALLALAAALTAAFALPGHASAYSPTRVTVDLTASFVLPTSFTGCAYPVNGLQVGSGVVTTYYDQNGNPTDIYTRTPGLTVTYTGQNGKSYTTDSPASTHVDLVNNTITYDGLEQHIVLPGQGNVGAVTGHVVFNTQTGALLTQDGQSTMLTPFSPTVCSLLD